MLRTPHRGPHLVEMVRAFCKRFGGGLHARKPTSALTVPGRRCWWAFGAINGRGQILAWMPHSYRARMTASAMGNLP